MSTEGSTLETIAPILSKTYGDSDWTDALAKHLAVRIDAGAIDRGSRERMIMLTCWDWMTGGGTAENVAKEIEEALS